MTSVLRENFGALRSNPGPFNPQAYWYKLQPIFRYRPPGGYARHPEANTIRTAGFEVLARGPGGKFPENLTKEEISDLDLLMLGHACSFIKKFEDKVGKKVPPDWSLNVNLSAGSLVSGTLLGDIGTRLSVYGIAPEKIAFEIVEEEIGDLKTAKRNMRMLHKNGHPLLMDDYGAGHSNFDRLKQLRPLLSGVKFDRRYLNTIHRNDRLDLILDGRHLNKSGTIVLEGAEHHILSLLGDQENIKLQSFDFSRPLTETDAYEYARDVLSHGFHPLHSKIKKQPSDAPPERTAFSYTY